MFVFNIVVSVSFSIHIKIDINIYFSALLANLVQSLPYRKTL